MGELISKPEFAKRIGVSANSVYQAIRKGRIDEQEHPDTGQKVIDYESQLIRFVNTTNDIMVLKKFKDLRASLDHTKSSALNSNKKLDELINKQTDEMDMSDAAELTAILKAKKASVEYLKIENKTIDIESVVDVFSSISSEVRAQLIALPDRVVSMMEGLSYNDRYELMHKEITSVLKTIGINIRKKLID